MHCSYETAFAFIKECQSLGEDILLRYLQKLSLQVRVGELSFTEIPAKYLEFGCVVGVSGTLRDLTPAQLAFLRDKYNLSMFSFMPCAFGINKQIKFIESCPMHSVTDAGTSTQVHVRSSKNGGKLSGITVANDELFYDAITDEIIGRLLDNQPSTGAFEPTATACRGVLVFFATDELLADYEKSKKLHRIYEFGCTADNVKVLNTSTDDKDRPGIITRAGNPKFVTLCSREFGRGEDFFVTNSNLIKAGGLHVLQTFLSDEISEEIQVRGRTGRQDNPGSFSIVLAKSTIDTVGE
jgi:hypothetical protein